LRLSLAKAITGHAAKKALSNRSRRVIVEWILHVERHGK